MNNRTVKHAIANLRRHYNLKGEDILACYDTAVQALFDGSDLAYITVSVSPSNYDKLKSLQSEESIVKHPGSNVECIKMFGDMYVRSEARIPDAEVRWSKAIGAYTMTPDGLVKQMEAITLAPSSRKKQIDHANRIITKMLVHPNQKNGKPNVEVL